MRCGDDGPEKSGS